MTLEGQIPCVSGGDGYLDGLLVWLFVTSCIILLLYSFRWSSIFLHSLRILVVLLLFCRFTSFFLLFLSFCAVHWDGTSEVPSRVDADRATYLALTSMNNMDGQVYFDARRFSLMQYCQDEHFPSDVQVQEECPTGTEGWAKLRQHKGGKCRMLHRLLVRVLIFLLFDV